MLKQKWALYGLGKSSMLYANGMVPSQCLYLSNMLFISYISYLVAMKKTEESLRRLKKGKISAFSLFNSGSSKANKEEDAKDDERIRAQMVLDVTALGDDLRTLGINAESHISFLELKTLASQSNSRGKQLLCIDTYMAKFFLKK